MKEDQWVTTSTRPAVSPTLYPGEMLEDLLAGGANNSLSVLPCELTLASNQLITACLLTKYGSHLANTCSKSNH